MSFRRASLSKFLISNSCVRSNNAGSCHAVSLRAKPQHHSIMQYVPAPLAPNLDPNDFITLIRRAGAFNGSLRLLRLSAEWACDSPAVADGACLPHPLSLNNFGPSSQSLARCSNFPYHIQFPSHGVCPSSAVGASPFANAFSVAIVRSGKWRVQMCKPELRPFALNTFHPRNLCEFGHWGPGTERERITWVNVLLLCLRLLWTPATKTARNSSQMNLSLCRPRLVTCKRKSSNTIYIAVMFRISPDAVLSFNAPASLTCRSTSYMLFLKSL